MKPNIFNIATKELSQDAFITWLLQWADSQSFIYDKNLNKCGIDFVNSIIKKQYPNFDEEITKVKAGRQWNNIDVWAEVNDNYLIIIEDKTYTGQHSDQLRRYKEIAEKWCKGQSPEYLAPVCIYLKTGNESQESLSKVRKEGFNIYNRKEFINLLQNHELSNDIYNDFKSRLLNLEKVNNQWETKLIKEWNGNDWQGFYQFLEQKINIVNWGFVNNPNGGFWSSVLSWDYWDDNFPVYLQTEEGKLCFKISTDPGEPVVMPENVSRGQIRNKISNLILSSAKIKGFDAIKKPIRFGNGKYMTAAIVESESWLGSKTQKVNKEEVVRNIQNYKNFLLETIKSN